VTFTVEVDPDLTPLEGNVLCSGNAETDRLAERTIARRLAKGEIEAWCTVVVKVAWEFGGVVYEDSQSLGCVVLELTGIPGDLSPAEVVAKEHDMYAEALDRLNHRLWDHIVTAQALAHHLESK